MQVCEGRISQMPLDPACKVSLYYNRCSSCCADPLISMGGMLGQAVMASQCRGAISWCPQQCPLHASSAAELWLSGLLPNDPNSPC